MTSTAKKIDSSFEIDYRPFGEIVRPTRPRVKPADKLHLPFIGMEHIEAHTMKLLGTVPAGTMKSSAIHFQPGDVLYGRLRPYLNKVYQPSFEGLCSAEFIVFPTNERIYSGYLQYFLNSSKFVEFASNLNTGDRPRVDFDQLASYPFPLVPVEMQKILVAEIEKQFSRLDEAVANLKRVKANLKRYKAAVLKAAVEGCLVEPEAEIARSEGRSFETGEQLLERILIERRKKWEEAELAKMKAKGKAPKDDSWKREYKEPAAPDTTDLPELPEGWTATALGTIAKTASGGTPRRSKSLNYGGGIPWVKSGELGDSIVTGTEETITVEGLEDSSAKVFPKDTLCIALYGATVGRLGVLGIDAATNQAVCGIFPVKGINKNFLRLYLEAIRGKLIRLGQGGAQPNISQEILRDLIVPIPSIAEQARIVTEVDRRVSFIRETEAQIDSNIKRSERLRQSILGRAFSGDLLRHVVSNSDAMLSKPALVG